MERLDPEDGQPVWDFTEGSELPGENLAIERLGVGTRTEAWLVWKPGLWSPAVMKLARPHQVRHPRALETLCQETAALAGNLHPGLPRLLADGTSDPVPHLLIEYIDGPTLDEEIDKNGAIGAEEAALLGAKSARREPRSRPRRLLPSSGNCGPSNLPSGAPRPTYWSPWRTPSGSFGAGRRGWTALPPSPSRSLTGEMRMYDYDLVVIGSGPGGQKAAIAGAKLGKSVARRRTRLDARRRLRQHRFGCIRYPQWSAPRSKQPR